MKSHQSQQEYIAGWWHGYRGGERPARDKGAAYYGGWIAGVAERGGEDAESKPMRELREDGRNGV